jgi:hypothetical protein
MSRVGAAALAGFVIVSLGCATLRDRATADRDWREGRWKQATQAYEAALAGERAPSHADRLLYRLGLAYAAPESPVHDAARARARLGELVARYPSSPYREPAEVVLGLVDALEAAAARLAAAEANRAALTERLQHAETGAKVSEATVTRLQASLAEARAELEKAKKALEELKRIDLGRPGGG